MPYNTRRKSLSLPSLGIHIPVTHAARAAANRASPNTPAAAAHRQLQSQNHHVVHVHHPRGASPLALVSPSPAAMHPSKKAKRSRNSTAASHSSLSPSPPPADTMKLESTPPPSPRPGHRRKCSARAPSDAAAKARAVDLDGINDEIVEAVIVRLQATGNRPHLVKELTAVLMQQLKVVQQ